MSSEEDEEVTDPCFKCLMESEDLKQCQNCEHVIKFLQLEAV